MWLGMVYILLVKLIFCEFRNVDDRRSKYAALKRAIEQFTSFEMFRIYFYLYLWMYASIYSSRGVDTTLQIFLCHFSCTLRVCVERKLTSPWPVFTVALWRRSVWVIRWLFRWLVKALFVCPFEYVHKFGWISFLVLFVKGLNCRSVSNRKILDSSSVESSLLFSAPNKCCFGLNN